MQSQGLMLHWPIQRARSAAPPVFARMEVRRQADAVVREAWDALEQAAPCSLYQTRAWLLPWFETLGRKKGVSPAFLLAWGADARPLALLCLGLRRRGPLTIASFGGGKDGNFSFGLFQPTVPWSPRDLRLLLTRAACEIGVDAYVLTNQPHGWQGSANPLAALPHQPAPSHAYGTALGPDAEAFFAGKLSNDSRKKLRKKEARLAAMGPVTYRRADTAEERARVLDAFFQQRLARFRAQGIASDFDDPQMRAFLDRASAPDGDGAALELHLLAVGERIVAVFGGGVSAGAWSGAVNSFDADPQIAKSSPGDLLLMKVIAAQCALGRSHFDLGVGEARYKATFCDTTIPLFDSFVAVTAGGWLFTTVYAAALRAKRAVKREPRLFALAKRLRSLRSRAADQAT